jgi:sec-independent protein translocase protein TatB
VFGNVGWGELFVLMVAALVILGPERLPGAVSWTVRSLRQVREYATGASRQLKDELGPEFEDLRKPLAELQQFKGMTPRAVITKHLLDGDDSIFTGKFDETPASQALKKDNQPSAAKPLTADEKPPFDVDAT